LDFVVNIIISFGFDFDFWIWIDFESMKFEYLGFRI
jgi:hypothetical protein